ncbi:MAG: preprotein translocase subunit SecY [Candidatus Micrarchaeota archaeon]
MASPLAIFKPILSFLPEIRSPTTPPGFSERLIWTGAAIFIFFAMYNTLALGVDPSITDTTNFLQVVTASRLGSLLTTGIGPIVLASIFLQLFVGAKIISVDMQNPEEKMLFHGTQKMLAIILCFFEAFIFVHMSGLPLTDTFGPATEMFVIAQIALGSLILLFMDEIVSKYGIGSGISLFIAAGVSLAIVGGSFSLFFGENGAFHYFSEGGAQVISHVLTAFMPLVFTVLVFLVIVYVEGIKVEIPLAFGMARGLARNFPIKFMYVSNIPVILAFALLANFQFLSLALAGQNLCISGVYNPDQLNPAYRCEGGIDLINIIGRAEGGGEGRTASFIDGFLYLLQPVHMPQGQSIITEAGVYVARSTPLWGIPEWIHIATYITFLVILCIVFGSFWVETTGMGAQDVANQLNAAGLQIPGYRRDPRVVKSLLDKYIPPIVLMGSAFVGLLAGFADLFGALGTGTGILLTVGIIYRMYQDMEKQNALSQNALLAQFLGK